MSDLQLAFGRRGTDAAFPTSSLVFRCCLSDLQRSFSRRGTIAAFPTSDGAPACKPAVLNSFRAPISINPLVTTVFRFRFKQTRRSQQFSSSKRVRKCGKRRVCGNERRKTAGNGGFAEMSAEKLRKTAGLHQQGCADVGFAAFVLPPGNRRCVSDIRGSVLGLDVGFAALVWPARNRRCNFDIRKRLAAADVGFAALVCPRRNRCCVSDIRGSTFRSHSARPGCWMG